jgi:hypothetical protein
MSWVDLRAYVIANTGWTWAEVGKLTLPRLNALFRQWRRHPPVHHLVASYLGFKPSPDSSQTSAQPSAGGKPPGWMSHSRSIPAPQAARDAATSEEAFQAFEHMFFGEVKDVEQI